MSASDPNTTIYMTDPASTIKNKVNKHAFSGGGGNGSAEEQRKFGGNPDVDISFQYLGFFEEDDELLARLADEYRAGKLLSGELKKMCIEKLQEFVTGFQKVRLSRIVSTPLSFSLTSNPDPAISPPLKRRAAVTDDITRSFMDKTRAIDPSPANKVVVQADGTAVAAASAAA